MGQKRVATTRSINSSGTITTLPDQKAFLCMSGLGLAFVCTSSILFTGCSLTSETGQSSDNSGPVQCTRFRVSTDDGPVAIALCSPITGGPDLRFPMVPDGTLKIEAE